MARLSPDGECVRRIPSREIRIQEKSDHPMREKISREEVRHVAQLARLELLETEEVRMTEQMNQILTYMDTLNELDTEGISPTTHAIRLQNVFRQDEVCTPLDRESALANAPETDGGSFIVPKVI